MIARPRREGRDRRVLYLGSEAVAWLAIFLALVALTMAVGVLSWCLIRFVAESYHSVVTLVRLLRAIL